MGSMPKPQERVSDRISALPNEVLCHILSFLPTKYVVRTTVLSKKWNNIWTSVPNLYFCDDDYPNVNAFISFVDHVLDSPDLSRIDVTMTTSNPHLLIVGFTVQLDGRLLNLIFVFLT
ncbi:hypothetical protein PS2_007879 [Malus domestica]